MLSSAGKHLPPHGADSDIARSKLSSLTTNFDPGNPDFSDQEGAPLAPTARALSPASAETTLGRIAAATNAAHNDPNACRRCRHKELTVDRPTSGEVCGGAAA